MLRRSAAVLALLTGFWFAANAQGWWDTVVTVWRPVPLVSEHEAESLPGVDKAAIESDAQADGGRGGQAVKLEPGGKPVTLELDIEKPGQYALFGILRDTTGEQSYAFGTLSVLEHKTNQTRSWTLPMNVLGSYNASAMFYFPAYAGGKYTLTFKLEKEASAEQVGRTDTRDTPNPTLVKFIESIADKPRNPLLLDRLELRDVFGNIRQGTQLKAKRMLPIDEELAGKRQALASKPPRKFATASGAIDLTKPPTWFTQGRSAQERKAQNDAVWHLVPDFNAIVGHDSNTWNGLIRSEKGKLGQALAAYELTGNKELGMDAAVLLVAIAEKYPALDYFAHALGQYTNISSGQGGFGISISAGKNVYRGWAGKDNEGLLAAYDRLFDFIKDNQALADDLATRLPGIKTPADVIRFLDRTLLHASVDGANRCYISGGDSQKALAALILGPGPDADKLLDNGIFHTISMNMTHRGGIDDHAISSYNRDGVHYIGSTGYFSPDMVEIADILHQYRLAGGNARYDLNDPDYYPNVAEANATIGQIHAAGGFRFLVGDAGDLRNGRLDNKPVSPPRILGAAGLSILETGQDQDDPLRKAAVGLTFGIGRGHAHQDTLNIEILALGTRASPDLGGRHEAQRSGKPNMRDSKLHNVVEVDDANFHNPFAGSTTSGTGWNTGFFPQDGAQYMEHYARATSHPQVSIFTRQTTLLDIPASSASDAGNYIFDVLRVKGGKVHTYNFHGGVAEAVKANIELSQQLDEEGQAYLHKHFDGSKRQGVAPAMLQVDWPMTEERQKAYQKNHYTPDKQVVTRLSLFGVQGQKVLVANAYSDYYKYNFPFLHVRSAKAEESRQSVYPAIIEPFAGQSLIESIRQLPIDQAKAGDVSAPVALEVKTKAGTTDLLYSSLANDAPASADKLLAVTGKAAVVSTDAKGLRLAKLVGGTKLESQGLAITTPAKAYHGKITGVDYRGRSLTIDQPLPANLLNGQVAGIGGGNGLLNAFVIESVQSKDGRATIKHFKTARYYQSTILNFDTDHNAVTCEIDPPVFGADTRFIDGTTVSNEAGSKFARVRMEESERWMHLGWPGYRGSYPTTITLDDVPDANGDGKRTFELLPKPGAKPKETEDASTPLTMEVTRIDKGGQTFHFKLPEDANYQQGGWHFNFRTMRNEAGKEIYRAIYPGSSYRWIIDGMTSGDFTDADDDGKTKLMAYLYGPGDRFELDTFVQLTRQADGSFLVQANTPFWLSLPSGSAKGLEISVDGKSYKALNAKADAGKLSAQLTADDLANGKVWLRLK